MKYMSSILFSVTLVEFRTFPEENKREGIDHKNKVLYENPLTIFCIVTFHIDHIGLTQKRAWCAEMLQVTY